MICDFSSWGFLVLLRSTPHFQWLLLQAYPGIILGDLHKSWHKKRVRKRNTGVRSLNAPHETPIRRPGSKSCHVCSRPLATCLTIFFFSFRPKYNCFQPDGFLFWIYRKNRISLGSKQHRAHLLDIERTGPRGGRLGCFSAGETGRWHWRAVDRQNIFSNSTAAAVFVTATLQKGCNFWNVLQQQRQVYMLISEAASLHLLCCCPFWAVLLSQTISYLLTIRYFLP